ncbi:MAG: acyltransferase domain-containing protein [Rhodoferax sp.]|nr:acyltransferase domain-containing protein [Rhodoferax sp.]
MSYAVLFSGQGTQHPAMLPWLESAPAGQAALQAMGDAIGSDWRAGLEDAQRRSRNAFAQPLLVGTALAAWAALAAERDAPPAALAGYSVGELPAYACAGVFSPQTAITLALQRAALMDAAVAGLDTGLLSVSGLPVAQVLCAQPDLDCAIAIGADQAIYAGMDSALGKAAQVLTAQGALCKRLDVRVASHSRWMASAAQGFARQLEALPFARPHATLVLNATGSSTRDPQVLRNALSAQIAHTVQWAACMDALAEQGVACVIEVGAGTTLSKMWNQRHPDTPARSLEEFRDVAGAARWIRRHAAQA